MIPVLRLEGVGKVFNSSTGSVEVLREVNLELFAGTLTALIGPSGSGKSTLLHLAALLDRPSSGKIYIEGSDSSRLTESARCSLRAKRVSLVFQKFCLLPHRTALQNVLLRYRYLTGVSRQTQLQNAKATLTRVGLADIQHRRARLLSGGEMQRVAIARAMAPSPPILLADEPTGNLDPKSAQAVMDIFEGLSREGMAILIATHNPTILPPHTRIVKMQDGQVIPGAP